MIPKSNDMTTLPKTHEQIPVASLAAIGFEQSHTFVVVRSGASGTFVTKLLGMLYDENRSDLIFSETGHSHEATPPGGNRVNHMLNCGVVSSTQLPFADLEEKITYYRGLIEAAPWRYFRNHPGVTSTHIHTHIPLYKVLFPNSKILVITCDTIKEKAVSLLHVIMKYMIATDTKQAPGPAGYAEWLGRIYTRIVTHLGQQHIDIANIIVNDIHKYSDVILYFSLAHQFAVFSSGENSLKRDIINIEDFENCTILPYSCIINGNSQLFLQIIESIHGIKFTDSQTDCALRNFKRYHECQNQSILSDPIEFFKQVEIRAISQLTGMVEQKLDK